MTTYTITVTDHGDVAAVADGGTATITVTEGGLVGGRFQFLDLIPGAAPAAAPDSGDNRLYLDTAKSDLLRQVSTAGVNQPHWPIYVIPNGGTVPAGLAPHTIILEEGP